MGGLSEVQYDVDAFSKLVLPAEKKELIMSFILHSEGMKNDLISGKGGGGASVKLFLQISLKFLQLCSYFMDHLDVVNLVELFDSDYL